MDYERLIKWLREFEGPGSSGTNEAADAIEDIWADFSKALEKLAESRARFADSEARIAELEAVIEKARTTLQVTLDDNEAAKTSMQILTTTPSVVLEDRDREVAARAVEEAAREPWVEELESFTVPGQGRVTVFYLLNERAAAIRKGDTNV